MSERPPVFVVTCPVPPGSTKQLRVELAGRTVTATGPGGFSHTVELPPEVAADRLGWQVHADVLELRAPLLSESEGTP